MRIAFKISFFALIIFFSLGVNCLHEEQTDTARALWTDCHLQDKISLEVFNTALSGSLRIENLKKANILTIIDYSKASSVKRFFVIDTEKRKLLYHTYVAHGKNSGEYRPVRFSNLSGSLQSSLGFFLTGETYMGENGYSMKLEGLEQDINDNARERDIVIHGADYVSEEYITKYGRLGRSWGCPALPLELSKEIIDLISNGSCLFVYAADSFYLKNSNFTTETKNVHKVK